MQVGMVGLGRMGGNMARRLMQGGHDCFVYDIDARAALELAQHGATPCASLSELVASLAPPRAVWIMVPAPVVDAVLDDLAALLQAGDVVVDGGNTFWKHDVRRAAQLAPQGIVYVDVGTSGGVRGLQRGYCLMAGGTREGFERIEPLLQTLAPGSDAAAPTPGRSPGGMAEQGYLHCGPAGAGHFVKMVHNAIEYGIMAAYAEGFNLLHQAGQGGASSGHNAVALDSPQAYRYDFDLAEIAELWRRGSVIGSWLLDLTAQALHGDPGLQRYTGTVSDSGEGRWALDAAVELGVPAPVLAASLFNRFESRDAGVFAMKTLSAMREQFGGHLEAEANEPPHEGTTS